MTYAKSDVYHATHTGGYSCEFFFFQRLHEFGDMFRIYLIFCQGNFMKGLLVNDLGFKIVTCWDTKSIPGQTVGNAEAFCGVLQRFERSHLVQKAMLNY